MAKSGAEWWRGPWQNLALWWWRRWWQKLAEWWQKLAEWWQKLAGFCHLSCHLSRPVFVTCCVTCFSGFCRPSCHLLLRLLSPVASPVPPVFVTCPVTCPVTCFSGFCHLSLEELRASGPHCFFLNLLETQKRCCISAAWSQTTWLFDDPCVGASLEILGRFVSKPCHSRHVFRASFLRFRAIIGVAFGANLKLPWKHHIAKDYLSIAIQALLLAFGSQCRLILWNMGAH